MTGQDTPEQDKAVQILDSETLQMSYLLSQSRILVPLLQQALCANGDLQMTISEICKGTYLNGGQGTPTQHRLDTGEMKATF
jgi:hypothetical protein